MANSVIFRDFAVRKDNVVKNDKQGKTGISGRLKLYLAWPLVLCTILIAMNAAIYIIDADVAILVTLFIFVYALLAIAIYIFGKVGFKAELTRYALEVADT